MSDRLTEDITKFQGRFSTLKAEVGKVLVGQDDMLHRLVLGLLAGGHVLLEGVPGLAKTLVIRTLAEAVDGTFSRIQFTPDMLPGDVVGTQVFNPREGTYPLPEAQLDRFMLKVKVGYPTRDDEVKIIDRMAGAGVEPAASKVMTTDEIVAARELTRQVFVDDKVKRYAVDLVAATRDPKAANLGNLATLIDNGASPRASIALIKVAKAQALLAGRSYISPHDVKTIAHDVLRHRILVSYEAEAQGKTTDHVIAQILENVPVP